MIQKRSSNDIPCMLSCGNHRMLPSWCGQELC